MSTYFLTLLTASVCGAVCTLLAWGGFEKYVKYIAALVCTVIMISPFKELKLSDASDYVADGYSYSEESGGELYALASQMTEERAEEYISQIVFAEFGIKVLYTDIRIDWDKEEPIIEEVTVALSGGDIAFAERTSAYLENTLGSGVTVIEG